MVSILMVKEKSKVPAYIMLKKTSLTDLDIYIFLFYKHLKILTSDKMEAKFSFFNPLSYLARALKI